jgi:hypothetical protein
MNERTNPAVAPADRPVFVLGERAPASQLVRALGETPTLYAMPPNRLLAELVWAVDRCAPIFEPIAGLAEDLRPAAWYRELQLRQLQLSGKARTVEFSGLSAVRLCSLFPHAQLLVVRRLKRAMPRSRRVPELPPGRLLEIDSEEPMTPEALDRVLAFLGEPAEPLVLDLSDSSLSSSVPF